FGRGLLALLFTGFGLTIKSLGDRGGPTDIGKLQDFDFEIAAVVRHTQHVSNVDVASWFHRLSVGLNSAQFAGAGGESPAFEKARSPEKFVDANRGHKQSRASESLAPTHASITRGRLRALPRATGAARTAECRRWCSRALPAACRCAPAH